MSDEYIDDLLEQLTDSVSEGATSPPAHDEPEEYVEITYQELEGANTTPQDAPNNTEPPDRAQGLTPDRPEHPESGNTPDQSPQPT